MKDIGPRSVLTKSADWQGIKGNFCAEYNISQSFILSLTRLESNKYFFQ